MGVASVDVSPSCFTVISCGSGLATCTRSNNGVVSTSLVASELGRVRSGSESVSSITQSVSMSVSGI